MSRRQDGNAGAGDEHEPRGTNTDQGIEDLVSQNERLQAEAQASRRKLADAEDRLQWSAKKLRLALLAGDTGMWEWDTATNQLTGSERAWTILGVPAGTQLGYGAFLASVDPADRRVAAGSMQDAVQGHRDFDVKLRYAPPDGTRKWIAWRGQGVDEKAKPPARVLGTVRDVTERKRMLEVLQQAETLDSMGRLASGVAHDFNNMLGPIVGYSDLLVSLLKDPQLKSFAEIILHSAHRAADLTSRLLGVARKGKQSTAPVDIHELIEDVARLLELGIDRRIAVLKVLEAPSAVVLGNQTLLYNALLNLAVNARDAMPEGGTLTFTTKRVELGADASGESGSDVAPGEYLQVSVKDSGVGMTPDAASRAFEPFFTTKERGTGMGLAQVQTTVRNHGGTISVQTRPGDGSTFTLLLPLPPESTGVAVEARAPSAPHKLPARVLVIDDDDAVRSVMADMLEAAGYRVRVCQDGRGAVGLLAREPDAFDLAILDIVMPGLTARETLRELRRVNPKLVVLISSGCGPQGEAQELLALGAVGFVQKPFGAVELVHQVQMALGASATQRV